MISCPITQRTTLSPSFFFISTLSYIFHNESFLSLSTHSTIKKKIFNTSFEGAITLRPEGEAEWVPRTARIDTYILNLKIYDGFHGLGTL